MASPVDAQRDEINSSSSAITSANLSIPAALLTMQAGELTVTLLRWASTPGTVTFTNFTQLVSDASDATDDTTAVYYRYWTASTDVTGGVPISWTTSAKYCAITWRITGAANPATRAPEISTVAVGTTAANTANPGSVSGTGGSKDYLFLALMGLDGEGNRPTGVPTNYTNLAWNSTGTTGAVATNCSIGGGSRQLTAASDDPGVFTHPAATTGWTAWTVVIHPPTTAAPGAAIFARRPRKAHRYLTLR